MFRLSCLALLALSITARLLYADWYPYGFSGHAVAHALLRKRIYDILFVSPWSYPSLHTAFDLVIKEHHGPQSLLEALLTPLFGFGFLESRMIVSTLGVISILLAIMWGSQAVGRWFGLAVGLAVSMAPHHLAFSRNGDSEHLNIFLHGFLLLLTAQRTITSRRWYDFVAFGVSLGLSLYVYATNQFLGLFVAASLLVVKVLDIRATSALRALGHAALAATSALLVMWPLLREYAQAGRYLPIRTPYVTTEGGITTLDKLPLQLHAVWLELFQGGVDAWFLRQHGAINDGLLWLAPIGLITLTSLCASALGTHRRQPGNAAASVASRSIIFVLVVTLVTTFGGVLPGAFSAEPSFRRLALVALGVDILKGAGIYGLGCLAMRYLPRIAAIPATLVLALLFSHTEWRIFMTETDVTESRGLLTQVSLSRAIKERAASNVETKVLLPSTPGFIGRNQIDELLRFDTGFPPVLPAQYKPLDWGDLPLAGMRDLYIPAPTFTKIMTSATPFPQSLTVTNPRPVKFGIWNAYILADVAPAAPKG